MAVPGIVRSIGGICHERYRSAAITTRIRGTRPPDTPTPPNARPGSATRAANYNPNTLKDFDLVIVGAGPGGSNAAAVALAAGLRVVQLDAARFPRVKPCAGGVTLKAARALEFPLQPSIRASFSAVEFNLWRRRSTRFVHSGQMLHFVCRPDFDSRLVELNLARPDFTFLDGRRVKTITFGGGRFSVTAEDGTIVTGRQLIGADGAHSVVNRTFGVVSPRRVATAIEVNIRRDAVDRAPDDVPSFDYGAIEEGYGWVFPKDDHWSIGLYTLSLRTRDIRAKLLTYIASKGCRPKGAPLAGLEAARLPVGGFRLRVPECPVYVVGDAGGFADALTGEGIYAALESGRLAARTAIGVASGSVSHRRYYRRLWRSVLSDTAASFVFAQHFYRDLDRGIRALQHPLIWRPLVEGFGSGATLSGCLLKGALYLPRSVLRGDRSESRVWRGTDADGVPRANPGRV
jgi:geranylgeranyl reductase family protein